MFPIRSDTRIVDVAFADNPPQSLGILPEQAQGLGRKFAATLDNLAQYLKGCRTLSGSPDHGDDCYRGDGLCLSKEERDRVLNELRRDGAILRGSLSDELMDAVRAEGFPAVGGEEPALMFIEHGAPVQVLWEMMYEGGRSGLPQWDRDWDRFWGFRVPITNWITRGKSGRTGKEIRLRNGLFTAVSDDLFGAGQEEMALTQHLRRWGASLRHDSLVHAVRERVLKMTGAHADNPTAPLDWGFFGQMSADEQEQWRIDALVAILKEARDHFQVIHFACHCAAGDLSQLYSCLVMSVAGVPLRLDAGLMFSDLKQAQGSASGPLVFLNACGTAQPSASGDPPAFPETWLRFGATAVIATLCPVPDRFAHAFAVQFYEFLSQGIENPTASRHCYLAEALLATRRHFMQPPYNNPLGLAYVLYARHGAHILPEGPPR
jgi:hypothetical protein